MEAKIVKLRKELEESKEEIKIRSRYEGNTEALEKMLSKQKKSKDTGSLGFEEGQSSTHKDKSSKEIMFTSSIKGEEKKTFTVGKDTDKKTCRCCWKLPLKSVYNNEPKVTLLVLTCRSKKK